MNHLKLAFLILLLLPGLAGAQKKAKKPIIPAVFNSARFVFVQAEDGEEFDRRIYPEDRMAIADLRDALHAWGRYTITAEREKADLVFVVRKGRLASADVNGSIGAGQDPQVEGRERSFRGTSASKGLESAVSKGQALAPEQRPGRRMTCCRCANSLRTES